MIEARFFVPLRRDAELSDGELHTTDAWEWLNKKLMETFDGHTVAPGYFHGVWKNPATGRPVADQSRQYLVAVPEESVELMREMLKSACRVFPQQCIYLSVGGKVEFVKPDDYGQEY